MLEFKKNDSTKLIDEDSKLIPVLIADGWSCGDIDLGVELDIDALKEEAEELGIKVHHKAKAETIAKQIAEFKGE